MQVRVTEEPMLQRLTLVTSLCSMLSQNLYAFLSII